MRLAFLGTPGFAVPALEALALRHDVVAVYSQPPRPVGRGQAVQPSAVHEAAKRLGIAVRTPSHLRRDEAEHAVFAALDLDVAVVAAYGLLLPPAMLTAPRLGCLNIHASLLPRWRGAAPIQAAILAGDRQSGVTVMQMEAGLDTGPMLLAEAVPLTVTTTTTELHDALAALGARLILHALDEQPLPTPQPADGATYAPKLGRDDAPLDWSETAETLDRRVRALNPWPGTRTTLRGEVLKIVAAVPEPGSGLPGTLLDDRLAVACGQGVLRLRRLQRPGRAAMDAAAFLRGTAIPAGTVLGG